MTAPAHSSSRQARAGGAWAWIAVALLWAVWLLNYLDRQVIFAVFPVLQSELGLTAVQLGLVSSAFLWVYAIVGPFAGYAADRFGRKPMIVFSVAVWSAVTFYTGQARTLPQLLAARGLMGLSEACYLPAGLALIAAAHGERTRAKATGIHYSGGYLGMILGGGLGGWMAAAYGWRRMFFILGVIGLAYAAVLWLLLRDRRTGDGKSAFFQAGLVSAIRELFRVRGYTTMFAVFAATSVGNWISYTWLPLYLYERFHMSLAEAGFKGTFYLQAGSFAGICIGGVLADRWAQRNSRARILIQAAGLTAAAPFLFLAGFTNSAAVLIVGMAVFGIGRGIYDANGMPALCEIAPDHLRSTGYGLFNFIGPFAGGIVATAAGAMKSRIGIGGSLEAAGFLLMISALALSRIRVGSYGTNG